MEPVKKIMGYLLLPGIVLFSIVSSCKKNDYPANVGTTKGMNLQMIADGFVSPLSVVEPPDSSHRLFIVDQAGKVWIVDSTGAKMPTPFLDLTPSMVTLTPAYDERGLLSIAFHPDFRNNGKFYAFYTAPPRAGVPIGGGAWNNLTRISEFNISADPNQADLSTERVILEADHPQLNHDGGTIAFGPDGYLYISIGDGGNADDIGPGHVRDWYAVNEGGNGQDIFQNLMGNILRINIDNASGYTIPTDNPFISITGSKPEVYAYGFRNPYRFSFDMSGDHALYVGDAGQSLYEEIDVVTKGGNYGWNVKEGTHCFSTADDMTELGSCPMADSLGNPLLDPVIELKNFANPTGGGLATVIVGGNVYRGSDLPGLTGKYIFGIFSQDGQPNAKIYSAMVSTGTNWPYENVSLKDFPDNLGQYLKGFGQDQRGELYLTTSADAGLNGTTGKVYKLVSL
ncbi:MAG: hypothetical protein JWM28_3893 [Chitinophagaceae bacterium]|nr:hypothetical protein [Chitinophagaceae bacterium]